MNRKTIIVLVGLLVMALAAVGVGYGLWFEDLQVEGTVTTGAVDVGYSGPFEYEWFTDAAGMVLATQYGGVTMQYDHGVDLNIPQTAAGLFELKDNVECDAYFDPAGPDGDSTVDTGDDHLMIMISGAYPSYHCRVEFDIENLGTVPVHLTEWMATPVDGMPAFWVAEPICVLNPADLDTGTPDERMNGEFGVIQLEAGEHANCYIDFHFENDTMDDAGAVVAENSTYHFAFEISAEQFNESMPADW